MSSRATAGTRRDPKHLSSRYGPESGNELRARYFGSLIAVATPNFSGPLHILFGWSYGLVAQGSTSPANGPSAPTARSETRYSVYFLVHHFILSVYIQASKVKE
jgi:hypothetical protein